MCSTTPPPGTFAPMAYAPCASVSVLRIVANDTAPRFVATSTSGSWICAEGTGSPALGSGPQSEQNGLREVSVFGSTPRGGDTGWGGGTTVGGEDAVASAK